MRLNLFPIKSFIILILSFVFLNASAQNTIQGKITDETDNGAAVFGATITVKGTTDIVESDMDGKFKLTTSQDFPFIIVIESFGLDTKEIDVKSVDQKLNIKLGGLASELGVVDVVDVSKSKKETESALTMESMNSMAIKRTPSADFYEGLGALKGVDLMSASIGFKVLNTRGFNSTSPVRSLQIIDGVDNQAPGLNFSLGNFLGSSELDLKKVDIIVGASSAFYGPNAFNGVISMETKDPFIYQGLSAQAKMGERGLFETAFRYAKAFKNKNDRENFALKFNIFYLKADDWIADNMEQVYNTQTSATNWGGYDAINRYGDEEIIDFNSKGSQVGFPGLRTFHRTGYEEKDIVDYDTKNLKTQLALHYKFIDESQIVFASNFGTGTTVYQGDNRISLRNILFFQNKLEYKGEKGFIRAYATHEDAGDSYDAVFTALLLQNRAKDLSRWSADYAGFWKSNYVSKVRNLPGFPALQIEYDFDQANAVMELYSDSLTLWHNEARLLADQGVSANGITFDENIDRLEPGTPEFEEALREITTSTSFTEGGSRFYDKSALYHIHGERKFILDSNNIELTFGSNVRIYTPVSNGTLFSDSVEAIVNREGGMYAGIQKVMMQDRLKLNGTIRVDKNENFPVVLSPAVSAVYNTNENSVLRVSFSSATRNPTLTDQYLYYNTGRAILLGNINGYDSLVTIESAIETAQNQDPSRLEYFNVKPIVPEKVRTIEIGFRSLFNKKLYLDASAYYSTYRDFIGYNIGLQTEIDPNTNLLNVSKTQAYRIAANAKESVTTQGASLGLTYYFKKFFTVNGNYSWNKLNTEGTDDPIIPAFNTPEHKFNLGFGGNDISAHYKFSKKEDAKEHSFKNVGFNINFKWIQGFLYEGSPQFTGEIPSYFMLDAQVNKHIPKIHTTLKIGASNILNNKQFQVYGGPRVGRMAYFSILVELDKP